MCKRPSVVLAKVALTICVVEGTVLMELVCSTINLCGVSYFDAEKLNNFYGMF